MNELINQFFPELNGKRIQIVYKSFKGEFMSIYGIPYLGHKIYVSKSCRKLNKDQFTGVLAHELVHISTQYKDGIILTILKAFRKTKKMNTMEERMTDIEVINRGLGSQLLEFMKYHDKHYKKYKPEDGLTTKEIKSLL